MWQGSGGAILCRFCNRRCPQHVITVIIPTLNADAGLTATLASVVSATVQGLVREVIVVDGGSTDSTLAIVEDSGAQIIRTAKGRGAQLAAGAAAARMPWLLFLHADTVLEPGWENEVAAFTSRVDSAARPEAAASFRFALDDTGFKPRVIETGVALRCTLLRLPYGDQALLVPRRLYDQLGGYRNLPLMEDVDFVRRLGRRRTIILRARAVTSAIRYRRDGYFRRSSRNLLCLFLFFLRVPPRLIARLYH